MKEDKNSKMPVPAESFISPGTLLKQAREAVGQTHANVGEALHLTGQYIRLLESDDYAKLPGLIFVKGYIRSYATYLKLDVNKVLAAYELQVAQMPKLESHTLSGNYTRKRNDQALVWALGMAVIVVVALVAGWWFVGRDSENAVIKSATSTANATAMGTLSEQFKARAVTAADATLASNNNVNAVVTPTLPTADVVSAATAVLPVAGSEINGGVNGGVMVATPVAPSFTAPALAPTLGGNVVTDPPIAQASALTVPTATVIPSLTGGRQINLLQEGPDAVQLTVTGDSWVEINDGQAQRLYEQMLNAGDVVNLQGQGPFDVLLGNGNNVSVSFNGAVIDVSGSIRADQTARLQLSNPNAISAALEAAPGPAVPSTVPVTAPAE